MVNIGIDFGSTYTMVGIVENGDVSTVSLNGRYYSMPSIAAYDEKRDKYYFGDSARSKIGQENVSVFRGFKMLLDRRMSTEGLAERGYTGINTPEHITELFIREVITKALKSLGEEKAEKLVIGAPECWFRKLETVDARGTLRDICSRMNDLVSDVRIISEPTNAAAFCVWNYERETGSEFSGRILVVDYGGGTLDTALVNVRRQNGRLNLKPEMRSGRGENSDREVGKAGIAYQEAVVKRAISETMGIAPDDIAYDKDFDEFVKRFEETLINNSGEIDEIFEDCKATPGDLADEECITFTYKGTSVTIDYGQMRDVYMETIYPVLDEVLKETAEDITADSGVYLALVGGFCKFYLVREQINDFFGNGALIARERSIVRRADDGEKAIAYGAGLFADDAISLCCVSGIGIGMCATFGGTNQIFRNYAINYMQEYVPDKIYYARDINGQIAPMIATKLDTFLINLGKRPESGMPMMPKAEFSKKLNAVTDKALCVVVGFSIDIKERITVHIYKYDIDKRQVGELIASIELSTFRESFDNAVIPDIRR